MATELSLVGLFAEATLVVKLIMLSLVGISILSWSFIFQRAKYYKALEQIEDKFEQQFYSGKELLEVYKNLAQKSSDAYGIEQIFKSGFHEYFVSKKNDRMQPEAVLENSKRAMDAAMRTQIDSLEKNLSFLATVGSVSPYVGLFGTVWGIMHSFIALGSVQQATLSMVAPGIAEALIATAMGLFAAIPAVISYNRYANRVNEMVNKYEKFQINFTNVLARQVYAQ